MHWFEGVLIIIAGCVPFIVAAGVYPRNPVDREELGVSIPIVRNKKLMYEIAGVLWVCGVAVALGFLG
jgi:hypothetical protein